MSAVEQKIDTLEHTGGALSPEQAEQMLNHLTGEGETAENAETAGKPDASAAPETTEAKADPNTPTEPAEKPDAAGKTDPVQEEADPSKTVVLAKDGVHTIPYEKHAELRETARQERQAREQAEAQAQEAQRKLAQLEAQLTEASRAAEAAKPPAVAVDVQKLRKEANDALIDGDTDKAAELNAKADAEIMRAAELAAANKAQAEIAAAMKEMDARFAHQQRASGLEVEIAKLYEQHPDADAIYESKELRDWIASMSPLARKGYEEVLAETKPGDVSEMLDEFKESTFFKQPPTASTPAAGTAPDSAQVAAAAKAAITNARTAAPATLSDIPGSKAPVSDAAGSLEAKAGPEMLQTILASGWDGEQIETFLNRSI